MYPRLPADEDVNDYFDLIVDALHHRMGFPFDRSVELARDYYLKFTDEEYCRSLGILVQNDDFFFHEGVAGMALRIYYSLVVNGTQAHDDYVRWRAQFLRTS